MSAAFHRRLDAVKAQWDAASASWKKTSKDKDDAYDVMRDAVKTVLSSNCEIIREAAQTSTLSPDDIRSLVEKAWITEDAVIELVYSSEETIFDFIPPFCGNVCEDSGLHGFERAFQNRDALIALLLNYADSAGKDQPQSAWKQKFADDMNAQDARNRYDRSSVPSAAHTTKIAHFRLPVTVPADASNFLRALLEARLEARSVDIVNPSGIELAGNTVVVIGGGGVKGADPVVHLWDHSDDFSNHSAQRTFSPGMLDKSFFELTVDHARGTFFVSDRDRIKSYSLSSTVKNHSRFNTGEEPLPVHTLDSRRSGPMAVIGSRLFHTGSSNIGVWDIDTLPTHGPEGVEIIGDELTADDLDTYRSEYDLEFSSGTEAHRAITVADSARGYIESWAQHPSGRPSMICAWGGEWHHRAAYGCVTIDLETGQLAERWLGHGGKVHHVRTNSVLPNYFVTSCGDGTARLYDVRVPVPVFAPYTLDEHVFEAILLAVDGKPFIASAGAGTQSIRMWDVQGQKCLYELATGNNEVSAMAWDASNQTLFAATECQSLDRIGYHHNYRRYKPTPWEKQEEAAARRASGDASVDEEDEEEDDDVDDDDDDDDYEERCWPKSAFRSEDYWGYSFDAGDHRLFRYTFKHDANIEIVPPYGDATMESGDFW